MKNCDTCCNLSRFRNLKNWQGRIGICDHTDYNICSISGNLNCKFYQSKKYREYRNKKEKHKVKNLKRYNYEF